MAGFATQDANACVGCTMCPDNNLLAIDPVRIRGVDGYVVPGSAPVEVANTMCWHDGASAEGTHIELVPMPFSAVIATTYHNSGRGDTWGFGFRSNWEGERQRLIRAIPGLTPDMPRNEVRNVGFAAGARAPKAVNVSGRGAHAFEWVVYGRGLVAESPATENLGFATILYNSRRAAGSVPSLHDVLIMWQLVRDEGPQAWKSLHDRLLRYALDA